MASLTEQDVVSLVQAATDAARAASNAVVALHDQQANRSGKVAGFQCEFQGLAVLRQQALRDGTFIELR